MLGNMPNTPEKARKIKLLIVDFHGVITNGSYKEICQWIADKYAYDYDYVYKVVYHKHFTDATLGKISEKESFQRVVTDLNLKESWQALRKKHLSYQRLNKHSFNLFSTLQDQGYTVLLLSKNTREQFRDILKKFGIRAHFQNIFNTLDLKQPKGSRKTIAYVKNLMSDPRKQS